MVVTRINIEKEFRRMKTTIAVFFFVSISTTNAQVAQEWVQRYNGPLGNSGGSANHLAIDASSNVYVTGFSSDTAGGATNNDCATIKYNSSGVQQWVRRYNGPANGNDAGSFVAVDGLGNVYVTGNSAGSGTSQDYITIKYNSSGVQQWVARYNGPGNGLDNAVALAVDGLGNVYVTGNSPGSGTSDDCTTIKYNSSGVQLWLQRYNGANDFDGGNSVAVDVAGNVYVAGYTFVSGATSNYITLKYNSTGFPIWNQTYNGPGNGDDFAISVSVNTTGVYVSGYSTGNGTGYDHATIKYNSSGVQQWVQRYNGPGNASDVVRSMVLDASSNVYVAGSSQVPGTDYATVKYSSSGVQQWAQQYNGTGNSIDQAWSIAVDVSGDVYVTGYSVGPGSIDDFATVKYNSSGMQQWVQRYNGPGNLSDRAVAIAVDTASNVYTTGFSTGPGVIRYYTTIKYAQLPNSPSALTALAISSNRINLGWADNSNNEAGFKIERRVNTDTSWILIDSVAQNTINHADTGLTAGTIYHYRIYAFNAAGNSAYSNAVFDTTFSITSIIAHDSEIPNEYKLYNNYPNPFNPSTTIRFSLPRSGYAKLIIFNTLGEEVTTLIAEDLAVGTFTAQWDAIGISSGIYFYRLQSGKYTETKKLVLLR